MRIDDRALEALTEVVREDLPRFGRYRLVRELGRGGLGVVWLARDDSLQRLVALKIVSPEHRGEAQVTARLQHPRIAAVYEAGEGYIAMQYVDGRSLEGLTLPPKEAARVVRDAARVIQFAHEKGVVHRDVKPGNLMLSGDDVWVVDFGLSALRGAIAGTAAYMGPEQAAGAPPAPGDDVYALGATLRRLANGRGLEVIVAKATAEPARRYRTAGELADDLDRFVQGRLARWARRLWLPLAAAAVVAAFVLRPSDASRVEKAHQQLGPARQLVDEARLMLYKKGAAFSESFFKSLDKAAAGAQESLALHETSEGRYLLGRVHHLRGSYDEALAEYERALARGRSGPVLLAKARAYVDQAADAIAAGDEAQATWLLASARRIFDDVPGLSRRMKEAAIESELTEAWRRLAEGGAADWCAARVDRHEEFALVLGLAHLRAGDPEAAIGAFTKAIDARPNYWQAHLYRGAALEALGRRDFAQMEYDRALAIHPRYAKAWLARR